MEYYVVRNERIPELAIYSFEAGERFEPDFFLFVRKKNLANEYKNQQIYIEPKGSHLLDNDKWKEDFLLEIESKQTNKGLLAYDYDIIGMPFFNSENRMDKFEEAIDEWIKNKL